MDDEKEEREVSEEPVEEKGHEGEKAPEEGEGGEEGEEEVPHGDLPKVNPEVVVQYCSICSLPTEYCEFIHPAGAAAPAGSAGGTAASAGPAGATPAAEGGGGGKKKKQKEPRVTISTQQRQKRKFITVVDGLESCGVKLAEAAKFFGKHFSCGASVTARETGTGEEIVIQGDVTDELPDILIERWQVPEAAIIVQERKEKREKKR